MKIAQASNARSSRRLVLALLALLAVNALLLLPLWWRDGAFSAWLIPELLLLPLLIGMVASRWWPRVLAAILCFALLALAGDALVREVLDRPLNLALDPLLLRAGYHFLAGSLGFLAALLIAIGAAVLVGLIVWSLNRLICASAALGSGAVGWLLAVTALMLVFSGTRFDGTPLLRPALVALTSNQVSQVWATLQAQARLLERARQPRFQAQPIPAFAGRDVIVIFVESYGLSAWKQDDYRAVIEPVAVEARRKLQSVDLEIMTTRLRSPIRGGQSWLAHASLLSGQRIDNDLAFRQVLASDQGFLSDDFAATGHQTLVIAPAIVRPWPEAEALGFDHPYPAAALDFRGPGSGWVGVPDQFTLHRFSQLRSTHTGPTFSLLMLISSHAPWLPGPPLLDDWTLLGQDQPWPDWTPPPRDRLVYLRDVDRLRARYPESVAYSLSAVFDWAARDLTAGALLLVLGDHQPATLITGSETSWDVPVHLIGRDASKLVARTGGFGFRPGVAPPPEVSRLGLEDLREWFRGRGSAAANKPP